MEPIRVGHVGYLNAWPLVEGLDRHEHLSLIPAIPADLVGMLTSGEVDVALVSTADLVRTPEPIAVLRGGMIASDGPTTTVKLISRVPIERITTIHADIESHTSVALCRLLLAERTLTKVTIEPFRVDGVTWPEAVLMIGDKVITTPLPEGVYTHQLDLGAAWFDLTKLPMVYAVWACLAERCDEPWVRVAASLLDHQRRHNATRLALLAARRAADHGWPTTTAITYFTEHMCYDLDERAARGLTEFVRRGARAGVLPENPVRWVDSFACAHGRAEA